MPFGLEISVLDNSNQAKIVREFRSSTVRIGRNELNDFQIEQPFVSQFHAIIEIAGEELILRDLGSTNGSIVRGEKISSAAVTLGRMEAAFSILVLDLEIRALPLEVIAAPKSQKKAMNVTGYLDVSDELRAVLAAAAAEEDGQAVDPEEQKELKRLYDDYRRSWFDLHSAMQTAAMSRPTSRRGGFITQLSSDFPASTQEPDFHRLADAGGASSMVMRDPVKEQQIALEGLKELASEYLPNHSPLETPDELVQFITSVRAVLDLFFKAFLPLRDGQRQFERELSIGTGRGVGHPVETANSPAELSAALLTGERTGEGIQVVESTLADIMIHHVAMLNGVMTGVKTLLAEISPQAVREAAAQMASRGLFSVGFGGGYKQLWQAFESRHADLAEEEKQLFGLLFGRQFSQAYTSAADSGLSSSDRMTMKIMKR